MKDRIKKVIPLRLRSPLRSVYHHMRHALESVFRFRVCAIYRRFQGFTMIPRDIYTANLRLTQRMYDIPGDVVECGVWRGGMSGGMATLLGGARRYWLFDSFEGLPAPDERDGADALRYHHDEGSPHFNDNCRADKAIADEAMARSGASDVCVIKGWFNDTLPNFPMDRRIAVLRLDGDWYGSVMCCLRNLYPRVVQGGLIIIDDYYYWDGASRAVHDFLSEISSADRVSQFDNQVAYILKGAAPARR